MKLNGKTVCFLGDSITEGAGASSKEKCYVSLFAAAHPEAKVLNFGIGGTRIAKQTTPSENPRWDLDFGSRVAEMPEEADLICIFGGTNDFGHGDAPMGSFGCKTSDTFWGALYALSLDLVNKYPKARIVYFTPLHRQTKPEPRYKGDGYWSLDDYAEAIRKNAAYFAFPVLDLRTQSGIQPRIPTIAKEFTPDGLHPNDAGYERLFRMIDRFIENLE